ncbi:pleckstrin homology domain-containing family A member 8 isoform X2 [Uranotaenia lowii]|uniref:pleckstrin homology domain-containing family A member 8 isoform X2 n=1 Tax=Uranotaenia lowii TaxID=190385 RepID=UPI00247A2DA2|nr:pleckstrin homology domain-containing family A member 8 isoform X2 [Uranotaenia lowii]
MSHENLSSIINDAKIDFSKLKPFQELEVIDSSRKIVSKAFIDSAHSVVMSIESFGRLFAPIVKDMRGNVKRLEAKYETDKEKFHYLENLVLYDKEGNETSFDAVTEGLLWLKRALEMVEMFFRNMLNDDSCSENVKHHLKQAYDATLLPYHGFLAQKGFQIYRFIINMTPARRPCPKSLAALNEALCTDIS